ncbi:MAG: acyltransferase [Pseudomonadota bacterium]
MAERLKQRLVELDSLRGVAALSVLIFHYANQFDQRYHHIGRFPYTFEVGRYGVHLFFLISGFVIFMSLENTKRNMDFVVSRLSRLFPAYWVALGITFAATRMAGLPDQSVSIHDALINATMLQDLFGARDVDGSYWTLQIELLFYMQMLLWFSMGLLPRIRTIICGWLILGAVFGMANRFDHSLSYIVREILDLRYMPFFSAGILLFRIHRGYDELKLNVLLICAAVSVAWLIWSWEQALALAVCSGIIGLFVAGRLGFLARQPLTFLGSISYTLYLLHQEIGFILISYFESIGLSSPVSILITTAVVMLMAWLLMRLIERPAMRLVRRAYRQWLDRPQSTKAGGAG